MAWPPGYPGSYVRHPIDDGWPGKSADGEAQKQEMMTFAGHEFSEKAWLSTLIPQAPAGLMNSSRCFAGVMGGIAIGCLFMQVSGEQLAFPNLPGNCAASQ